MDIYRKQFSVWLVIMEILLFHIDGREAACTLPVDLQSSSWTYTDQFRTGPLPLSFTSNTMKGFKLNGEGTPLEDYTCISSNQNDIYIFKADREFTSRGNFMRVYICMKLKKLSDSLYYAYFLSNKEGSSISPAGERVQVKPRTYPSDNDPTCDFCDVNNVPADDEVKKLEKQGSSAPITPIPSVCPYCDSNCITVGMCDVNPCRNNGTCNDLTNDYNCTCAAGWEGENCTTEVECPFPPIVDHSTSQRHGNNPGDSIAYTCTDGYEDTTGSQIRFCQTDGSWNGTAPSCTKVSCGSPADFPFSTNTYTTTDYGSVVTYSCKSGYERESGDMSHTCTKDKTWSGSDPVCIRVCPDSGTVPNTYRQLNGNKVNDMVIYKCKVGFEPNGEFKKICQPNGLWQWTTKELECHAVPNVPNELVSMAVSVTFAGVIVIGAIIIFTCFYKKCPMCKSPESPKNIKTGKTFNDIKMLERGHSAYL